MKVKVRAKKDSSYHPLVIAGFPGVGKSTAAEDEPLFFEDMESSEFHWINHVDDEGNITKVKNEEWPKNYVDAIIEKYKFSSKSYLLISTHNEVLEMLKLRGVRFIVVVPESKEATIKTYHNRGNDEKFITSMSRNWDKYMDDIDSLKVPVITLGCFLQYFLNMPRIESLLRSLVFDENYRDFVHIKS